MALCQTRSSHHYSDVTYYKSGTTPRHVCQLRRSASCLERSSISKTASGGLVELGQANAKQCRMLEISAPMSPATAIIKVPMARLGLAPRTTIAMF